MKKLIVLLLSAISYCGYSQTILTDAQKDLLYADASFRQEVKWGILNKASFWKGLDGTSIPGGQTAANIKRWSLSRGYAAQLINNPVNAESDLAAKQFLVFVKTTAVWQGSVSATVSYMLTNSIFDTLADNWFDNAIAPIPF
jgi:hypothetical protein